MGLECSYREGVLAAETDQDEAAKSPCGLRGLRALQVVERHWEVRLSKNNRLQIFYVGKGDWFVKL